MSELKTTAWPPQEGGPYRIGVQDNGCVILFDADATPNTTYTEGEYFRESALYWTAEEIAHYLYKFSAEDLEQLDYEALRDARELIKANPELYTVSEQMIYTPDDENIMLGLIANLKCSPAAQGYSFIEIKNEDLAQLKRMMGAELPFWLTH